MAGITPFLSGNTPLKNAPYFSRVASTNIIDSVDNVNYPMLAFKPGYALQASELNEIQENFYVQKTLSDNLLQKWWKTGTNLQLTGVATDSLYGPGWEGVIPLDPLQLTYAILSIGNDNILTFGPNQVGGYPPGYRWYLVTDPTTKFKFWMSINVSGLNISLLTNTLPPLTYVGLRVNTSFVNCSSTETDPGYIFNDNSSGNYIQNTCGASRYKIAPKNTPWVSQTTLTADFLPLLKIRKNADTASQGVILIQYMNNYLIAKTPA
jgi:hypothetical protein